MVAEPATVNRGESGRHVASLQRLLNAHGAGLRVDGVFGPRTQAAVAQFQGQMAMPVTGAVDEVTVQALSQPPYIPQPPFTEEAAWRDVGLSPDMDLTAQAESFPTQRAAAPQQVAPPQQPAPRAQEEQAAKQYLTGLPPERQNRVAAAAKQLMDQQGGDLRTALLRVAIAERKAIEDAEASKSRRLNLFGKDEGQLRVMFHGATDDKQRQRIMQAVADTAVASGWKDLVLGTHKREAQERVAKGYRPEVKKKETPLSKRMAELMLMESKIMGYRGRERRAEELHDPKLQKMAEATRKLRLANDKAAAKLAAAAKRQPPGASKIIDQAAFWMYYHKRRNLITDEQWRKGAGPFHEATERDSIILKAKAAGASKRSLDIIHRATQRMPTSKAPKGPKPLTEAERTRRAVIDRDAQWAIDLMGDVGGIDSPAHLKLLAENQLETGNWSGLMGTLRELQGAVAEDGDVYDEDVKRLNKLGVRLQNRLAVHVLVCGRVALQSLLHRLVR